MSPGNIFNTVILLLAIGHGAKMVEAVSKCGHKPADIFFLLDGSGSVNSYDFDKALKFVKDVVKGLDIGPNDVQIGLLAFEDNVHLQFHLNKFSTKQQVLLGVGNTEYPGGGTNTHTALQYVRENCFTSSRGLRPNAVQIAVVVTDGQSYEPGITAIEAERLRNNGVTIFSIGVGEGPDMDELNAIATDPDSSHVFSVSDYNSLNMILESIPQAACEATAANLCGGQADVVFLLDLSEISSPQDEEHLRKFVTGVTSRFIIGPSNMQIGIASFSTSFKHEFHLSQSTDRESLNRVLSSSYEYSNGAGIDTGHAIRKMREQSFGVDAGHRKSVSKIVILLTNSHSDNKTLTSIEVQKARDAGITMLVVGIGSEVYDEELSDIATDPDSQSVYNAFNFGALSSLEDEVAFRTCSGAEEQQLSAKPSDQLRGTKADIVFVIDSSGSVGSDNFKVLLGFINTIVKDLDIGSDGIRVGIETFGSRPDSEIALGRFSTKTALMDAISNIEYRPLGGGGDMAAAVRHMDTIMFKTANGDRHGVPNIGIILTDGQSNDPETTKSAVQSAKAKGVSFFAVGVGDETSPSELSEMASDPDNTHVLVVDTFAKLAAVKGTFLTHMSEDILLLSRVTSSPNSETSIACRDQIDCSSYDLSVCTANEAWATINCARTCQLCSPSTPTVAPPCVDKLPDCSVSSCGDSDKSWAMENCRSFCGYCNPGLQAGGISAMCFYKGTQYRQGEKWDDGCAYECECTDAVSGQYRCFNKCPSYFNFPDKCTLMKIPGKCCLEPFCNFDKKHTIKNVSESCVYRGLHYEQGQVWSVGCEFDCICVDPAREFYTCQSKCAQYSSLPSNCKLVTAPGKCCKKPVCEFQTQVGMFTGVGRPSGQGISHMNKLQSACFDKTPKCNTYGPDLCSSAANRSFALENCRNFCSLCDLDIDAAPSQNVGCLYKGVLYLQSGAHWYDGCSKRCVCENPKSGYIRCDDRCPDFLNLPVGCSMVSVSGQCCKSLHCDSSATLTVSQTVSNTVGAVPDTKHGAQPEPTRPTGQLYTTGCRPVEEGRTTTFTCNVDTTGCSNLFVATWKTDTRDIASCTQTVCGSSISGFGITASVSPTGSSLTVAGVSRTSPYYHERTVWSCGSCSGVEVTVCDKLEIFTKPEKPVCSVSQNTVSGTAKSVTVSCSTSKVYPKARCSFKWKKNNVGLVAISATPSYYHTQTGESPVYYRSQCSLNIPVEDLGIDTHSLQAYIYPDVTGGEALVDAIAVFTQPEAPVCTVNEDIVSGTVTSVAVSCSTSKVYPPARCSFKRSKNGNKPLDIKTTPSYSHIPTGDIPISYKTQCSLSIPPTELGFGTHSFQAYIYPDIPGGESLVDATTPNQTVTFIKPEKPICLASEDILPGTGKSVTVSCSTTKVNPKARCTFEWRKQNGELLTLNGSPNYTHLQSDERPIYFMSLCSFTVPTEDLGTGQPIVRVFIYPDITGGESLVAAITPNETVTFSRPDKMDAEQLVDLVLPTSFLMLLLLLLLFLFSR